jgi:hypothetical protein
VFHQGQIQRWQKRKNTNWLTKTARKMRFFLAQLTKSPDSERAACC